MPNNLVFNDVANQLKTSIYGTNGTNQVPIAVNTNGAVFIATSDPITVTANDLDIRSLTAASDTVTVTANDFDIRSLTAASDTVTVTANDFDIRSLTAASDTVTVTANDFDIRSLTAASDTVTVTATDFDIRVLTAASDTVTVTANDFDIRSLTAASDTVTVTANDFDIRSLTAASDTVTVTGIVSSILSVAASDVSLNSGNGTGTTLAMNTSAKSTYSYFIKNNSATPVTVKLQISPTNDDNLFLDDSGTPVQLASNASTVLVPVKYLNFTRLYYATNDNTAPNIVAYYNSQG